MMKNKSLFKEKFERRYVLEDFKIGHSILKLKSSRIGNDHFETITFEAVQFVQLPRELFITEIIETVDLHKLDHFKEYVGVENLGRLFIIRSNQKEFYVIAMVVKIN